jgi:hypothetical protein
MACGCRKNKDQALSVVANNTAKTETNTKTLKELKRELSAVSESLEIDLPQCYLCAKKHIGRAQQFFEEYHNGYPDHIRQLVDSMFEATSEVYRAFQLWEKTRSQMDMSAGELLGNSIGGKTFNQAHVSLAAEIREERLKLEQNPLYVPDFDRLKYKIHVLQQEAINEDK